MNHAHGLLTSSVGLKIRVNPKYFDNGFLQVKCVATLSPTMWNSQERANDNVLQQQLKQFKNEQIPLPSIDTKEVTFLGIFLLYYIVYKMLLFLLPFKIK
jgi:hypothetical protein